MIRRPPTPTRTATLFPSPPRFQSCPADAIWRERLLELLALKQNGEAGQRPFRNRCGCQRPQRRPEMLLGLRIDRDAFRQEDGGKPFGRQAALGRIVDARDRLKQHAVRSEEQTSELQSPMRTTYAVSCFKKKNSKQ